MTSESSNCSQCGGRLEKSVLRALDVPHRAFDRMTIPNAPVFLCASCNDILFGSELTETVQLQYRANLAARLRGMLEELDEQSVDVQDFERYLGLNVGDLEDGELDEKLLTSVCAAGFGFLANPTPKDTFQEYRAWLQRPLTRSHPSRPPRAQHLSELVRHSLMSIPWEFSVSVDTESDELPSLVTKKGSATLNPAWVWEEGDR